MTLIGLYIFLFYIFFIGYISYIIYSSPLVHFYVLCFWLKIPLFIRCPPSLVVTLLVFNMGDPGLIPGYLSIQLGNAFI